MGNVSAELSGTSEAEKKHTVPATHVLCHMAFFICFIFVLFAIFILHSRESELYRYTLDGKSALAWELPFSRFMGHLSST